MIGSASNNCKNKAAQKGQGASVQSADFNTGVLGAGCTVFRSPAKLCYAGQVQDSMCPMISLPAKRLQLDV